MVTIPEHQYALSVYPNVFDRQKVRAYCHCGWYGPYHRPNDRGSELARKEHRRHLRDLKPQVTESI